MKGIRGSKLVSILLVCIILVASLSGCSKKDTESTSSKQSMGRYIEEEIVLPEEYKDFTPLSMIMNEEGKLELFAYSNKSEKPYSKFIRNEEGTWEVKEQVWLNSIYKENVITPTEVTLGEDGVYYTVVLGTDLKDINSVSSFLYKCESEDKEAVKVNIPFLEEKYDLMEGYSVKPYIGKIRVLKNGDILGIDQYTEKMYRFDGTTGEKIEELEVKVPFTIAGNDYIAAKSDTNAIISNVDGKEEEIPADHSIETNIIGSTKDAVYLVNGSGIEKHENGGTLWQTVVDGDLTSLSIPHNTFVNFEVKKVGEQEEYYVLVNGTREAKVYRYHYEATIPTVPNKEITVYSINENSTIRQAINSFQKKNADVKVNYIVAMGEDSSATINDTIRALNTELLAGNGADILVLDGLPMDSFTEKGVLEDIKDIVKPMMDDGTLIPNIAGSYLENDKIYAVPVRFQAPLYYGNPEVVNALKSLDSLAAYIKEHPEEKVLSTLSYDQLATTFFLIQYDKLVNENQEINKEQFIQFLQNLKTVSTNIGSQEDNGFSMGSSGIYQEGQVKLDNTNFLQDMEMKSGKVKAGLMQLRSIIDLVYPFGTIRDTDSIYTDIDGMFISGLTVGMNSASKKKEIAGEFIKTLLSDEVQDALLGDGLPVNNAMLTKWTKEFDEMEERSISYGTAGGDVMTIYYPNAEETSEVFNYVKQLSKPLKYNKLLMDGIVTKITDFLSGKSTAEQSAQDTLNLINTYLAE